MKADIKLQQVYHRVQEWEEVTHNMWGKVTDRNAYIQRAIQFTGNHIEYGRYMLRVCEEWPISTDNAFTDPYLNHRAWVGHAACALAFNCPEDIVRQAWRFLTDEQKLLANKEASRAIADWRRAYIKDRGLRPDVAAEMLPGFDS
jgi:hypothetical protein